MQLFKSLAVSTVYLIALSGVAAADNSTVVTTSAGNSSAAPSGPAVTTAPSQGSSPNGPTSSPSNGTTGGDNNGTQTGTTPVPAGEVPACPTGWCLDYQFNPGNNTCITPDPVTLMDCWEDYCAQIEPGGYCLVWEPDSGRVCHGGMKKCYCSDYQTETVKHYYPDQMPDGWSAAQQCVYEGATGTTRAPAPPPVVPASSSVRTAVSVAGGAALGTLVIGNVL
ncbi:hypothetical protein Pmar_PMAR025008 [Perkinsus marinus ATCC 50983]|uniref:Merozoite surface protein 2 n=1 Tax=Perkinsus marinus (strain ATCC 50983 / TXsc) TaxID=423536 RepID=C5KA82_PERM5|nr:hypothetical protein Pmar_PMAR025008 [Perkinsus marinus ATCC 50983]EER18610.1 hypothetical protein Pmar_PMAR025008 [Perkinsus marinus ATCC 50983]|eukprot:XP_002786814.1 hypothetical protein Pmar_PMAR025008 [Perkinsus marinus ATCC 50983]